MLKKMCFYIPIFVVVSLICLFTSFANAEEMISSKYLIDVTKKHWAYPAIVDMVDNYQMIGGFPDMTFRGDKHVSRYELISCTNKFLNKLEKIYNINLKDLTTYKLVINDVPDNHWAFGAVQETLNSYHVPTHEFKGGIFEGDKLTNRYELAYTLVNTIQLVERISNKIVDFQNNLSRVISDLDDKEWSAISVKLAIDRYGLINIFDDNTFRGNNLITRYELVASFEKLAQIIKKDLSSK